MDTFFFVIVNIIIVIFVKVIHVIYHQHITDMRFFLLFYFFGIK